MPAYYNENDPFAAQWLRNLIAAGHIAPGDVDARSIVDVKADDLEGYEQAHFFAGIGGWSAALRLAGWPDNRSVWTGSCPCQPFSAAGAGKAADDRRHLWPAWFSLIAECRPAIVFGEQVEAAIGWGWLDLVCSDLESQGYACGAAVLPACGVGAPHIRQRLWFVAQSAGDRWHERRPECEGQLRGASFVGASGNGSMAHPDGRNAGAEWLQRSGEQRFEPQDGRTGSVEIASGTERGSRRSGWCRENSSGTHAEFTGSSPWRDCDWLPCTDGKARPVEPGTFPLAHGIPGRVGRLRAFGNAIVPQVAAEFIGAFMECQP